MSGPQRLACKVALMHLLTLAFHTTMQHNDMALLSACMQADIILCKDPCICTKAVQSVCIAAATNIVSLGLSESKYRALI